MNMTENEMINGWTFEETVKTTENLMEAEKNIFKWDVLRHLRDFAENYKEELEQYRAIGTVEEFKALKEKNEPKKVINIHKSECTEDVEYFGADELYGECPHCGGLVNYTWNTCNCGDCGGLIDWSE